MIDNIFKKTPIAKFFVSITLCGFMCDAVEAQLPTESTTDRLIVKYKENVTGSAEARGTQLNTHMQLLQRSGAAHALTATYMRKGVLNSHIIKLNRFISIAEAESLAKDISYNDPSVEYAEPDRIMVPTFVPNDPGYSNQWNYHDSIAGINLPRAWNISTGKDVTVAVIDTGYRPHVDLLENVVGGYDFISDVASANDGGGRDSDAQDPGNGCGGSLSIWHGTHVAGTVAAVSNNGLGVSGAAFNAKILPVRVLGCKGGYESDIASAIVWASGGVVSGVPQNNHVARVLNMSLSSIGPSPCGVTYQNAINEAVSRGAVVVVAAGNDNVDAGTRSPGNCKGVITVAAVDRNGEKAPFSNYGSIVDISAPGVAILSTYNGGYSSPASDTYSYQSGTSMAAPHVSGVIALMLSSKPELTPEDVVNILKNTAKPFPQGCSLGCGSGIVDATAGLLNTLLPQGNFQHWTNYSADRGAVANYSHYFADVNGDGLTDWIQVSKSSNVGWVGLARPDGSFQHWTNYSNSRGGSNYFSHYFADVNGDGRSDWIQVAKSSNEGWVGLAQADGGFQHWTNSSNLRGASDSFNHYFADVNGDGRTDWIQVSKSANGGWVGLARADGSFQHWTNYSNQRGASDSYKHFFADVNGDGRSDWIQVSIGTNGGWVGLAQADGGFSHWSNYSASRGAVINYEHHFADVNGDGRSDWIQISKMGNEGWVGLAQADGNFKHWSSYSTARLSAANYSHFFADVNGDGRSDWIQVSKTANEGWVGLAQADGNFVHWSNFSDARKATNNFSHYFVDVNGDGMDDWIQVAKDYDGGWVGLAY